MKISPETYHIDIPRYVDKISSEYNDIKDISFSYFSDKQKAIDSIKDHDYVSISDEFIRIHPRGWSYKDIPSYISNKRSLITDRIRVKFETFSQPYKAIELVKNLIDSKLYPYISISDDYSCLLIYPEQKIFSTYEQKTQIKPKNG